MRQCNGKYSEDLLTWRSWGTFIGNAIFPETPGSICATGSIQCRKQIKISAGRSFNIVTIDFPTDSSIVFESLELKDFEIHKL